jgi:hypothetical protein
VFLGEGGFKNAIKKSGGELTSLGTFLAFGLRGTNQPRLGARRFCFECPFPLGRGWTSEAGLPLQLQPRNQSFLLWSSQRSTTTWPYGQTPCTMHSLCTHYALTMHSLCTHYALNMHSPCTRYALTMHSPSTHYAPTMHSLCTYDPGIRYWLHLCSWQS